MHTAQAKYVQLGNCLEGLHNVPYSTVAVKIETAAYTQSQTTRCPQNCHCMILQKATANASCRQVVKFEK